jgi:aspartate aminotransferase-like enzyme
MLNDVSGLKAIARRSGLALCVDCVSALGAVPLDLSGVWLASGSSGKALASLPGLSFVFHAQPVAPQPGRLPRYLDLGYYAEKDGVPFTHSSNLVAALDMALRRYETAAPFEELAARAAHLRQHLRRLDLPVVVEDRHATPAVVTVALPGRERTAALGPWLEARGLLTAYQSEYLAPRNWLQIGVMGACTIAHLDRLIEALAARPAARQEERNDASLDRPLPRGRAAVAAPAGGVGRQAPLY